MQKKRLKIKIQNFAKVIFINLQKCVMNCMIRSMNCTTILKQKHNQLNSYENFFVNYIKKAAQVAAFSFFFENIIFRFRRFLLLKKHNDNQQPEQMFL